MSIFHPYFFYICLLKYTQKVFPASRKAIKERIYLCADIATGGDPIAYINTTQKTNPLIYVIREKVSEKERKRDTHTRFLILSKM